MLNPDAIVEVQMSLHNLKQRLRYYPEQSLRIRRLIWISVTSLILVSCAEPKYVQPSNPGGQKPVAGSKASTCEAQFDHSKLCLTWYWTSKPDLENYGALVFKVFRPNVLDGSDVLTDLTGQLDLVVLMPDMDHLPSPTQIRRLDTGTYEASDVFFNMIGKWELRFQSKDQDSQLDEAIVRYDF